jgi:hypothetical protein
VGTLNVDATRPHFKISEILKCPIARASQGPYGFKMAQLWALTQPTVSGAVSVAKPIFPKLQDLF